VSRNIGKHIRKRSLQVKKVLNEAIGSNHIKPRYAGNQLEVK